ncbi:glycosyltransferase family 4 protein [Conexibacter sp. JD483]|uniref:glycosyltransferase family 4 protein n=1 Tax=unclassified Conexibacter TaxID=2627773 RepID=UPI0027289652|nr:MULTISPECIES: glycosyltransferase family 4 protein [unclassified Conexibacter]MDO8184240.1 glycosyltransferase family 4 protein [Conexibacter sp. CPCC 205706]MDO8197232.1 glycosyltransferase family 4 protein [Conexibacter sp. CPCC 205762]MDR9367453.1 glycosyltransferase family 4 protein [Conexibacter sp. JD483]
MADLRVHALIDSLTWGGAESLLADLASGAPAAGIELTVGYMQEVDGSPNAARLRARGVEPELVGIARLVEPSALRRTRAQLARIRPDVVHTHLGVADVHGGLAARSLGIPSLSTIHLMAQRSSGDRRRDVKERLTAAVRRRTAARVITVSEAARRSYVDAGWDRPDHVVTVHNGIAPDPPAGAPAALRAELGLAPEDLVIGIVAVLRPGKGHDVLVEAVQRLLPRFPRLRVLVIGDGPALPQIRELVAPLGDAARLLGHRSDVPALLGALDVLLHPTLQDAFPTVLLEAGEAGTPVIATAVGGIPEIVEDGVSGLLLPSPPSADALAPLLERLLADGDERARLGAAARARFDAHFTAAAWASRLRELYDEVLAERSLSGR